jgi:two-component system NtrC family response regulator/two-component system response regulator HydG/two-component system response regulator AtoC
VIETREVFRLGGVPPVKLDVRFLVATNRDLARDVATGRFRRDLYFRVNGITLDLVPLRARRDAIPGLAEELLREAAAAIPRPPPRLTAGALAALLHHRGRGTSASCARSWSGRCS